MITLHHDVYCLQNQAQSYLLRVGRGLPQQIYFGSTVNPDDAPALTVQPGLGWGGSLLNDPQDMASSPEFWPMEWSVSGRGDYRESPMSLLRAGRPVAPVLHCVSHRILKGSVPMALPQAHGAEQTLEVVLEGGGMRLRLYWSVFPTAITRRAVLENLEEEPLCVTKLMSYCLDLPGDYQMSTFDGGWISETHRHVTPVGRSRVVNESTLGFSSARHNPGFLLAGLQAGEDYGRVYGFNLVYSGNHYAAAQQSQQGLTRVVGGISPDNFSLCLQKKQRLETPEAVLCCSDAGMNGLSALMHDFVNHNIVPAYWAGRERPILFNSWEGCGFDFTQRSLLAQAKKAKTMGCELFVLDDGWFGQRNDDRAGLGDYTVNRQKLPNGLHGLAEAIEELGLKFGLWLEPESVNPNSELYRKHPDWALTDENAPLFGRNQLHLDLTRAEVRDYIVQSVGEVLDSAPISYVKWDMNRYSIALGARAHDYILGLYDVLRRIFAPRPQILLEGCASGGGRFDLGMLCFAPQIWCSDNTDPIERLDIQNGLSYLYPLSTMGAHVSASPHAQTLRTTPLTTRGNVAFFGLLGYELDWNELNAAEETEVRNQIAFYRHYRRVFQFGRFRRNFSREGVSWQVSAKGLYLVGVFHRLMHAAPGYEWLTIPNLPKAQRFRGKSRTQYLRVRQFGSLIRHISPMRLKAEGVVLRTVDRHYPMPDGKQSFEASGAALASGICLAPRFSGTGYAEAVRMQGDFGSNVYAVAPIPDGQQKER